MATEWFYRVTGQQLGPVSSAELRDLATAGTIMRDTPIRKGDAGRWVPAEAIQGLFEPSGSEATQPPAMHAAGDSPPIPPPFPSPATTETTASALWSITRRLNERLERLTPVLLMLAIGLLVVSVILQGIMCTVVLSFHKRMGYRGGGVPVEITNDELRVDVQNTELPVDVQNTELPVDVQNFELRVDVQNTELDVKMQNHWIIEADPIPVKIVQ